MTIPQHMRRAQTAWVNTTLAWFAHYWAGVANRGEWLMREAPPLAKPATRPPRILVVDDDAVNQLIMGAALSRWGITAQLASDGAEAVALACGCDFDLILMDLQMPVLDGLSATVQIRRHELDHAVARVPVVAYTSSLIGRDPLALKKFGLDAALEKPCSEKALKACLLRWCAFNCEASVLPHAHERVHRVDGVQRST